MTDAKSCRTCKRQAEVDGWYAPSPRCPECGGSGVVLALQPAEPSAVGLAFADECDGDGCETSNHDDNPDHDPVCLCVKMAIALRFDEAIEHAIAVERECNAKRAETLFAHHYDHSQAKAAGIEIAANIRGQK